MSPFDIKGPSSFSTDRRFIPTSAGVSLSHVAAKQVKDSTKREGRNPGFIPGLTSKDVGILSQQLAKTRRK